jgi:hypothetical protein
MNEIVDRVNKKPRDVQSEVPHLLVIFLDQAGHAVLDVIMCIALLSQSARTRPTHRTSLLIQLTLIPVRRNVGVGFVDKRRFDFV